MGQIKVLLIFCLLFAGIAANAQAFDYWADGPDTSLTTVAYNTGGGEYARPINFRASIVVDVTGTESATIQVQVQPKGGSGYYVMKEWTAQSADTYLTYDGYVLGGTIRISCLSTNTGSVATTSRVTVAREPDAKFIEYWKDGPDTTASTRINEAGGSSIDGPLYYDMGLYLDVIGDTATVNVDFLPYGGATWIPFDTITAAKADTYYLYQGSTVGGKFRAGVTSTGAGSSALTMWTMYAKKED